ncbi:Nucleolar protein of 40 kDa [Homalodisca vitripennis]|nr:Nucleolar protein of 40 kDa [Homalodisca vitripennis]
MEGEQSNILNTIFLGEVASVQNYGAFVHIPGNRNQGLVHRSQISSTNVDDATEVLQRGERVWCKVISISEDGKIGLSMKVVNQGNGRDLDPNGVQIHQDEQKRKSMPPGGGRKKITLEAVLKTTCSKCGITGHLAKDCFQGGSGKIYELIPEDDINEVPVNSIEDEKTSQKESSKSKKRKKDKKHKKEKKKNKRKASSSESDSESDTDGNKRKERRKHKKRDRSRSRSPKKKRK